MIVCLKTVIGLTKYNWLPACLVWHMDWGLDSKYNIGTTIESMDRHNLVLCSKDMEQFAQSLLWTRIMTKEKTQKKGIAKIKNKKSMIQGVINIKRSICRIENRSKTEVEEAEAEHRDRVKHKHKRSKRNRNQIFHVIMWWVLALHKQDKYKLGK